MRGQPSADIMTGSADVMRIKGGAPTLRSRQKKGGEKAETEKKDEKPNGTSRKRKGDEPASPGKKVEVKNEGPNSKKRKAAEAEEKLDNKKSVPKTGRASRSKKEDTNLDQKGASQEGKSPKAVRKQAGPKAKKTEAVLTAKGKPLKRGRKTADSKDTSDKRVQRGRRSRSKTDAGAKPQKARQVEKKAATAAKKTAGPTKRSGGRKSKRKESIESVPQQAEGGEQLGTITKLEHSPLIVFAHGAGAGASSAFMQRWRELLREATGAVDVVTFDYPYLAGGKKGMPPKAEKLIDFHVETIKEAQKNHVGCPLVLAGKSMGSRVSCMVGGLEDSGLEVAAVVCLGYPLKGMGKGPIREQTLLDLKCPVIFVQGSRDSMCPLDLLEDVRSRMDAKNELHLVEGGDHGLSVSAKALKAQEQTKQEVEASALEAITSFLAQVT